MKSLLVHIAVAVLPFLALVFSTTLFYTLHRRRLAHRPLSYHRSRRAMERALATGVMLR